METPWGPSQVVTPLGTRGILSVACAGHGGIYVPPELNKQIPERERVYAACWSGDECWYEEDCAAAIPLYRLWEEVKKGCSNLTFDGVEEYFNNVKKQWEVKE